MKNNKYANKIAQMISTSKSAGTTSSPTFTWSTSSTWGAQHYVTMAERKAVLYREINGFLCKQGEHTGAFGSDTIQVPRDYGDVGSAINHQYASNIPPQIKYDTYKWVGPMPNGDDLYIYLDE